VLLAFLLVLGSASFAFSELRTLGDRDLSSITGQSGVTIYQGGEALVTINSLMFSDTDHSPYHWIEFRDVTIDKDGFGNYFSFDTPIDYISHLINPSNPIVDDPITFDVGTNAAGQTIVQTVDSSNMNPRTYTVGQFFFCDQELGSLQLSGLTHGPDRTRYGAHNSGIDFDYSTQLYASSAQYKYNTAGDALAVSGIHLAGTGSDIYDMHGFPLDPTKWTLNDPKTWSFTGNFKIGDIDAGSPATIDVATSSTAHDTALFLNLPMSGTLRVEDVEFGGSKGPIAIDGIQIHRLQLKIN
jgi:hypothetical protein